MTIRKGLTLALASALLSCAAKNDTSIELAAVCSFPQDASSCKFTAKCDTVLLGTPWVATRRTSWTWGDTLNSLDLPVQINNQMPSNASEAQFRTNTNDFTLEEFRLSFSSPQISIPSQTVKLNQLVPADGNTVALVKVLPEEAMATIDAANLTTVYVSRWAPNAYVEVTLKAFGHTRGGREIETEAWTIPVDVFDVDVPASTVRGFDPGCVGSAATVTGICPHAGQSATVKCE